MTISAPAKVRAIHPRTEDILELFDAEYSVDHIADRVGIAVRSVVRTLIRHGRMVAPKRKPSIPVDQFIKVWNESPNALQAARTLRIPFWTATSRAYHLRRKGLPVKRMTSHLTGPFSRGIL